MKYSYSGTVLIYSLILSILGTFIALSVFHLAQKFEANYTVMELNVLFSDAIQSKSTIMLQYWIFLNNSWWGFTDSIGCPQDITLSWSTLRSDSVSTTLRYKDETMLCQWFHETIPFYIYFNEDFTDTEYLELDEYQILFDSVNFTGLLLDSDMTQVDGSASFPLEADGIDDNFDSDNYRISSTGSLLYPDGYRDNDTEHRFMNFWYIDSWDDWYNIYWSNQKISDYIASNSNNIEFIDDTWDNVYWAMNIWNVSNWYVYLDIDGDFDIRIVRFDRDAYNQFNELIIRDIWESQSINQSWSWYLQSDGSLGWNISFWTGGIVDYGETTGSEFEFNFSDNDYAFFIRNKSLDDTLLYTMRILNHDIREVYSVPIQDDDPVVITMLGNHIIFWENWRPIWEKMEITQLK